jgi:hypothetical protein
MTQECEENIKKGKVELHLKKKACEAIKKELLRKSNHDIQEFE